MVMACNRPSGGCCAPRGLADGLGELLHEAGHRLPGARVRVYGSPRPWVVVEVLTRLVGGVNVVVMYRIQSLSRFGLIELTVPPEMLEPDDGTAPVAAPVPPPPGKDLLAAAAQAAREAFEKAGYRVEVIEAAPPAADGPVDTAAPAPAVAQASDEKTAPPAGPLEWRATAENACQSADGRFTIAVSPDHRRMVTVADLWTGESVAQLATSAAAHQWCRTRRNAPPLEWEEYGAVWVARSEEGVPFSVVTASGISVATDDRLASGAALRCSPLFFDTAAAKKWCEVRACCVVEAGSPGGTATLRYQDPIPF